MPKINRIAANLGVDEVMAAVAREHLRTLGETVDEAGGAEAGQAQAGELEGACARGVWRATSWAS